MSIAASAEGANTPQPMLAFNSEVVNAPAEIAKTNRNCLHRWSIVINVELFMIIS
jgi:hypothetical protein